MTEIPEKITSKRLIMREPVKEDGIVLYEAVNHKDFPEELPLKEIILTKEDADRWINRQIKDWKELKKITWTICLKNGFLPIGQISINEREDKRWHVAFWIHHEFQRKGYAKEALLTLTDSLDLKFWAGAAIWNEGSNRVLIKCGFKLTGVNENGYVSNGKQITINKYEKELIL